MPSPNEQINNKRKNKERVTSSRARPAAPTPLQTPALSPLEVLMESGRASPPMPPGVIVHPDEPLGSPRPTHLWLICAGLRAFLGKQCAVWPSQAWVATLRGLRGSHVAGRTFRTPDPSSRWKWLLAGEASTTELTRPSLPRAQRIVCGEQAAGAYSGCNPLGSGCSAPCRGATQEGGAFLFPFAVTQLMATRSAWGQPPFKGSLSGAPLASKQEAPADRAAEVPESIATPKRPK